MARYRSRHSVVGCYPDPLVFIAQKVACTKNNSALRTIDWGSVAHSITVTSALATASYADDPCLSGLSPLLCMRLADNVPHARAKC